MARGRFRRARATGWGGAVKALVRCNFAPRFIATAPALGPRAGGGRWRNDPVVTDTGELHDAAPAAPAGPASPPREARPLAGAARAARAPRRLGGRGARRAPPPRGTGARPRCAQRPGKDTR